MDLRAEIETYASVHWIVDHPCTALNDGLGTCRHDRFTADDTAAVRLQVADPEDLRPYPPALSDGSQHPDWLLPTADDFVAQFAADGHVGARPCNLAEVALCIAVECCIRESSRLESLPLPAPARPRLAGGGALE